MRHVSRLIVLFDRPQMMSRLFSLFKLHEHYQVRKLVIELAQLGGSSMTASEIAEAVYNKLSAYSDERIFCRAPKILAAMVPEDDFEEVADAWNQLVN